MEDMFFKILNEAILKDDYGRPLSAEDMVPFSCVGLHGTIMCDPQQLFEALIEMHRKYFIDITASKLSFYRKIPIEIKVRQEGIDYFNQHRGL